jgi:hypothetical protein
MTHDQLVSEIQRRAKTRGILTHACHQAQRCTGDRGQPDIVAVGKFRAAWLEIKSPGAGLEPAQTTWAHALKGAGQTHYIIRQAQLDDGTVDAILDTLAYGQPILFATA